jgi:cytochrome P450
VQSAPAPALDPAAAGRVASPALDRLGERFDVVADFARPMAAAAACALLRIPADRRGEFVGLAGAAGTALDALPCPPRLPTARASMAALDGLRSMFAALVGADGPTSSAGMLIAVVGVETAANVMANALLLLLDAPAQWTSLCADPELAERAVQHTLWLAPPVRLDLRVADADLELAGTPIAAGSEVAVCVDIAQQRSGAALDLTREPPDPLALAGGMPYAFVAPFVRVTASAGLRALAARRPRLRRSGPVARRLRAPVTRALEHLPVVS